MDTYELANVLNKLAKVLKAWPKVEIDDLSEMISYKSKKDMGYKKIKTNLHHLVALSRVDKQKWIDIIEEYKFLVEIRPRDSSWDVLGKLLRYLEKTPEAREKIKRIVAYDTGKASPELLKALSSLLKE